MRFQEAAHNRLNNICGILKCAIFKGTFHGYQIDNVCGQIKQTYLLSAHTHTVIDFSVATFEYLYIAVKWIESRILKVDFMTGFSI